MSGDTIQISIVSHGQGVMVKLLLVDIERHCSGRELYVTVTQNRPETVHLNSKGFSFPLECIRNQRPQGFSTNHNRAFRHGQAVHPCRYFCVLNPDVHVSEDVFSRLLAGLDGGTDAGVVAPLVLDPEGNVEDSARRFPRLHTPVLRALSMGREEIYGMGTGRHEPDWVAGMFMLFPASVYGAVGGFDERYWLYYEDIEICSRLRLNGCRVILDTGASVTHAARRDSRRKPRYFWWHLQSVARLFSSRSYWHAVAGGHVAFLPHSASRSGPR